MRAPRMAGAGGVGSTPSAELPKPLPWEYECVIIRRIQDGDIDEATKLVDSYQRLIRKLANKMASDHALRAGLFDDMLLAGELAVVRAAERYDLNGDVKFFAYVKPAIVGAIWFAAIEGFSAFEVPANMRRPAIAIRAAFAVAGPDARADEIAQAIGSDVETVRTLWSASHHAMSLSSIESDDEFGPLAMATDDEVYAPELSLLQNLMEQLDEAERDALDAYVWDAAPIDRVGYDHHLDPSEVIKLARTTLERLRRETIGVKQFRPSQGVA